MSLIASARHPRRVSPCPRGPERMPGSPLGAVGRVLDPEEPRGMDDGADHGEDAEFGRLMYTQQNAPDHLCFEMQQKNNAE